jgi:hypothetical protein
VDRVSAFERAAPAFGATSPVVIGTDHTSGEISESLSDAQRCRILGGTDAPEVPVPFLNYQAAGLTQLQSGCWG